MIRVLYIKIVVSIIIYKTLIMNCLFHVYKMDDIHLYNVDLYGRYERG